MSYQNYQPKTATVASIETNFLYATLRLLFKTQVLLVFSSISHMPFSFFYSDIAFSLTMDLTDNFPVNTPLL